VQKGIDTTLRTIEFNGNGSLRGVVSLS